MTQKSRDSNSCFYNYLPLLRADPASRVSYEMHIKYSVSKAGFEWKQSRMSNWLKKIEEIFIYFN